MLSIEEVQKIELDGLKELHNYCEKNNLTYLLTFGTLLGAMRHKGFIPWDNDVDVYMPRPDYEKLLYISSRNNNKISDDWKVLYYTNDQHYHYDIIRLCNINTKVKVNYIRDTEIEMGVWVDIFPLDGMHKKPYLHPIFYAKMQWYSRLASLDIYYKKTDKGFFNKLKGIIFDLFIKNRKIIPARQVNELSKTIDYNTSLFLATYGVSTMKEKMPIITFDDIDNKLLAQFEDSFFYIPANAERFLESEYGNWRELPPVEKRMIHQIEVDYK